MLRADKELFERVLPGKRMALDQRIRQSAEPRQKIGVSVDLPLSPAATSALAYAAEEAERLAHKYIGVTHLLLSVMRVESGAKTLLAEFGLKLEQLREIVVRENSDPANTFFLLQRRFSELASRLTPDIEPSFTFLP
jgi:ATP-dependent Clp protease ATP-binding subunit ClpA